VRLVVSYVDDTESTATVDTCAIGTIRLTN